MKKIILNILAITILSVAFVSCRKNDTVEDQSNNYEYIVKQYTPVQQLFTVNAATGGVINCTKGTKITFPPNCFANPDNSITTGTVAIAVKEALDKNQWLMSGLSTTATNGILISGGMVDIQATRLNDGVELGLAPAMKIPTPSMVNVVKVEVPKINNRPDTLGLFLPNVAQGGSGATPPSSWAANYFPFGNSPNSYIFQLPQFRWANCDALYNVGGTKTTITVTPDLTGVTGASNVQAMLVYRNLSSVITLPPSGSLFQSYTNSIPVGSVADIVCIGKDAAGKIIFAVKSANTFTALQNISIKPVVTDGATVTAYLNSIN